MLLPGRLGPATFGDLLGALYLASATGTLELIEPLGRVHRVHVERGLVFAVELDAPSPPLAAWIRQSGLVDEPLVRGALERAAQTGRLHGEVLVSDFRVAPSLVHAALRRQLIARLERLHQLSEAELRFRVTVRAPRGALRDEPLVPGEFLSAHLRGRRRDAVEARLSVEPAAARAFEVLGVTPGANTREIKRAYRALVRRLHPDRNPQVTDPERRRLAQRFASVTRAYRTLVA